MAGKKIELRSDTMTLPTKEMMQAIYSARVGDETWGEDPTVTELERAAAGRLGKEAGLFCVSGTMANTVSIMGHLDAGDAMILGQTCHISVWESPTSTLLGITQLAVPDQSGCMDPDAVADVFERHYFVPPRLICLENTHNFAGGTVLSKPQIDACCEIAHARGARVHVDGARIFNASVHLGIAPARLVENVDSLMFCLSKGLSAPMGSVAVGTRAFIERARRARKLLGGSLRQGGYMAASGLVALKTTVERLADDHANLRLIAGRLAQIAELGIDPDAFPTNILIFSTERLGVTAADFSKRVSRRGVLLSVLGAHTLRAVTHRCVTAEECARAADILVEQAKGLL